jgi:hypothetical protein
VLTYWLTDLAYFLQLEEDDVPKKDEPRGYWWNFYTTINATDPEFVILKQIKMQKKTICSQEEREM